MKFGGHEKFKEGCREALGTRVLEAFLGDLRFAARTCDPVNVALAGGLMLGVALLAGWLPARRASRADPMLALR